MRAVNNTCNKEILQYTSKFHKNVAEMNFLNFGTPANRNGFVLMVIENSTTHSHISAMHCGLLP